MGAARVCDVTRNELPADYTVALEASTDPRKGQGIGKINNKNCMLGKVHNINHIRKVVVS